MSNMLEYALRLNDSGFSGPLANARRGISGLDTAGSGSAGRLTSSFGAFATKLGVVGLAIGAVGAGIKGLATAISSAADMESTTVAFETLVGDAKLAGQTLKELKRLGAETPFEFPEIAQAGQKLIAFGESASSVSATLRKVGDVASGVQAPLGEIAEIYGKARVAGTLFAEDINQLTGRGIPVIQEFAKQLGVTESEVKKLAAEGKITFPMLERAFDDLTGAGGKFAGMMAKQSGTMNGLWSTLKDNIGELFTTLGKPINDTLKPMLQGAVAMAGQLSTLVSNAIARGQVGEALANALRLGGKMGVNGVIDFVSSLPGMLRSALVTLGEAIYNALTGSFEEAGRLIDSWSADKLRFDTTQETNFFKDLLKDADATTKAIDKSTKAVQTAQTAASAPAAAEPAGAASAAAGDSKKSGKIIGFSRKKAGLPDWSGAGTVGADGVYKSAWQKLQEREGRMDNGVMYPDPKGKFIHNDPLSGRGTSKLDGSTRAKQTRGFGGLDELDRLNNRKVPNVNLPAPNQVKAGAEKDAQMRRLAASASTSTKPNRIESLVERIAGKLDALVVA